MMRRIWQAAVLAVVVAMCGQGMGQTAVVGAGGRAGRMAEANGQAAGQMESLAGEIGALLADPVLVRAHWGVMVEGMEGPETGIQIYGMNQERFFEPASNNKLFTTAAAMALLGPERRFETTVTGELDRTTGTVTGDLVLKGGGDANFDSGDLPYVEPAERGKHVEPGPHGLHDLDAMADAIVAKGVKVVDGDVVGDDRLFPWEPFGANWTIDDAVWGYESPVSALTIADNQMRLTMATGATAGEPGTVVLDQAVPYYTIEGGVTTVATRAEATGMQVERMPGSRVLRVFGSMAVGEEKDVEEVAIDDPAEYAAMALKAALVERGVVVKGVARARHREVTDAMGFLAELHHEDEMPEMKPAGGCTVAEPDVGATVLAKHESAALTEDVMFANKESQNLHAELLLHLLGWTGGGCADGSAVDGAEVVRRFLTQTVRLDPDSFVFFDGSGLSGHDLVTPRAIARLLLFAAKDPRTGRPQPWFAQWKASLPVGGVDGTLQHRFKEAPLKGQVLAKTGTLGEARALSGYLKCKSGKTVVFSIMDGNHMPGSSVDRETMDKMVAAIWAAN